MKGEAKSCVHQKQNETAKSRYNCKELEAEVFLLFLRKSKEACAGAQAPGGRKWGQRCMYHGAMWYRALKTRINFLNFALCEMDSQRCNII